MIQDIVYQQNYAKKVNEHIQQVVHQTYMEGRQQGWNDMIFILNDLQEKNIELSQKNIVAALQELLDKQQNQENGQAVQQQSQEEAQSVKKGRAVLSVVK